MNPGRQNILQSTDSKSILVPSKYDMKKKEMSIIGQKI